MTGIILALISTACWALCSVIFKKLGKRLDSIGMAAVTSVISAFFLLMAVLISTNGIFIPKEYIIIAALSGILGISIGDSFFYASLKRLSPMVFSLIMFIGPDLFSGLFGVIFLKEFPPVIVWLGIAATLAGLAFFLFPLDGKDNENSSKTTVLGVFYALLSLICTSYSMVMIKPMLNSVPAITVTMYRMFFSALVLCTYAFITKRYLKWQKTLNDKKYSLKLFLTMILVTFGGFCLSLTALKYCSLVVTSAIMSLGPLFVFIFMVIFYRHKPQKKEYLGVLFTVIGIILICLGQ